MKNSCLAIAIGYPDLFWAISTAINVTGHAIEGVAVMMLAYLVLTLSTSGAMNFWYGRILRRGGGGLNDQLRIRALVDSPLNLVVTTACLLLLAAVLPGMVRWAVLDAVWHGGPDACHAAAGACWVYIGEKLVLLRLRLLPGRVTLAPADRLDPDAIVARRLPTAAVLDPGAAGGLARHPWRQ